MKLRECLSHGFQDYMPEVWNCYELNFLRSITVRLSRGLATLIIFLLPLYGCRENILHNLSEFEANQIISTLGEKGIIASKATPGDGKWSVSVESNNLISALGILDDRRMLKSDVLASKQKSSLLSSRESQRFEFERNLSQELERTLGSIDNILEARVHLNLPLLDPLFGTKMGEDLGTASVLLLSNNELPVDSEALRQIISGASGIPLDKISLVISRVGKRSTETFNPNKGSHLESLGSSNEGANRVSLNEYPTALLMGLGLAIMPLFIVYRKHLVRRKLQRQFESVIS